MADKEYVIDNPDKPIYTSLYQPIPLYDEEGHPLTDDKGRHRCKLICVNGGASATTANVKAAILLAFAKNRVTIKEVQQELSDTASSLTSSIDNAKQEFTSNINNTKQEFTSSLNSTKQELTSSINTVKTDLTSSVNTTKQELTSSINSVSSSLNTAKQDLSSNISNTKKEILDDVTTRISNVSKDVAGTYIKGLSVSGKTVTYTRGDGTTGTFNTQDTNTTYSAGSNITLSGTTFSLTKANVVGALGYTPPTQDTNTWNALKGSTTSAAGTAGYAPAPAAGATNRYLRCDGTWQVPPDTNTTYSKLSQFTNDSGYITSSGSCTYALRAGNGVDSYGTGWIRFKNGIQICWASAEFQQTVAYQKAFASEPRLICTCAEKRGETQEIPQLLVVNFYSKSATSFAGRVWNVNREDWEEEGNFDWIAIGSWK